MTDTDKARIVEEAERYGFQVPYDGSSEFYDRSAVKAYIAGATSEHGKARNRSIQDCLIKLSEQSGVDWVHRERLKKELESLKTNQPSS